MGGYLLAFEISQDSDELEIHFDEAGRAELIAAINRLQKRGDHDHLMTPNWGGNQLTAEPQGEGSKTLNKVALRRW